MASYCCVAGPDVIIFWFVFMISSESRTQSMGTPCKIVGPVVPGKVKDYLLIRITEALLNKFTRYALAQKITIAACNMAVNSQGQSRQRHSFCLANAQQGFVSEVLIKLTAELSSQERRFQLCHGSTRALHKRKVNC